LKTTDKRMIHYKATNLFYVKLYEEQCHRQTCVKPFHAKLSTTIQFAIPKRIIPTIASDHGSIEISIYRRNPIEIQVVDRQLDP
jgi:hypothetical protein